MIKLAAPYPNIQTITYLPNPLFSDSEALTVSVSKQQMMDGTLHTYVKTKNSRRKLILAFNLYRAKGQELKTFIQAYFDSKVLLVDHLDVSWVGNFTINPFDFETLSGERQSIQLEFEGCAL